MIFEAKPFEEYQKILVEQADYIEDWYHTFCFVISPLCRTVRCESKKPTPFGKATRDVRFPANTSRTGQSFPYISCARLIFEIAINISISASYSFLFHPKIFKQLTRYVCSCFETAVGCFIEPFSNLGFVKSLLDRCLNLDSKIFSSLQLCRSESREA